MKSFTENDVSYLCEINSPIFQLLKPSEVELIRSSKTQVIFHKGENLTKQGAYSSYILFIISGLVKKHIEENAERYLNFSLHEQHELIGLSSLFQQRKYLYTTVAIKETHAVLIESSSMQAILKDNASFAFEIIQQYCKENKRIMDVLYLIEFKQMYARLASALLYLKQWKQHNIFELLGRKELAAFAGLSVETTVKLLKEFEQTNLIKLIDKDIEILNAQKLIEYTQL